MPIIETSIRFSIDQPVNWSGQQRCLIVRGWCFAAEGKAIKAVRMRVAALTTCGVVGLPRPDVKVDMPEAPDDHTGFEIRGTLPFGLVTLSIEARLPDGSWALLTTRTVKVKPQWLPIWLRGGSWMERTIINQRGIPANAYLLHMRKSVS